MLIPSLMFALVPHKLRNDAEPFYGAYRPLTDVAFYMLNHSCCVETASTGIPPELTKVSDWGERVQPTKRQREG